MEGFAQNQQIFRKMALPKFTSNNSFLKNALAFMLYVSTLLYLKSEKTHHNLPYLLWTQKRLNTVPNYFNVIQKYELIKIIKIYREKPNLIGNNRI